MFTYEFRCTIISVLKQATEARQVMNQNTKIKLVINMFFNNNLAGHTSAAIAILLFLDTTKKNVNLITKVLKELDCNYYFKNTIKYWVI